MSAVAIGCNLHGNPAERVRELAGLALKISAGAVVDDSDSEGRHHEGIPPDVRQVSDFLGAQRCGDVGRTAIEQEIFCGDIDSLGCNADRKLKVDVLRLS